jgi:hypothetical protein
MVVRYRALRYFHQQRIRRPPKNRLVLPSEEVLRAEIRSGPPPLTVHCVVTPENEPCASRPNRRLPPRGC